MINDLLGSTPKTYPASLLLRFDGSNNSTTFTDSSKYNHTITRYGGTIISTAQSKFGGSSAYFDGTGDYLATPSDALFALGTSDFTVELWAYPSSYPGSDLRSLIDTRSSTSSGGLLIWIGADQKWLCYTSANSNSIQRTVSSIESASLNTWSHLRVTRYNGVIYFYVNGQFQGSTGISGSPDDLSPSNTSLVRIGTATDSPGSTRMYIGYIDDLRIVKGADLYNRALYVQQPVSSLSPNPTILHKVYNHLLLTTTKSTGQITGIIESSTGYYAVTWWDGTTTIYDSNDSFGKDAIGGSKDFIIYPCTSAGSMSGYMTFVDISNNELTSVRAFNQTIDSTASSTIPGYGKWTYYYYTYYNRSRWTWVPGQFIPGDTNYFNISYNNLSSSAIDQLYTDLLNGDGTIDVTDNPGVSGDTTSIATNKGYTVFGSTSPTVELLLNLNGTNGSTTFTDSGDNSRSITVQNGSPSLTTTDPKFGSASLNCNSGVIGNSSAVIGDTSSMDYTVEAWIYKTTTTAQHITNCSDNPAAGSTKGISFYLENNNIATFNNGNTAGEAAIGPVPTGVWTHIVGVKKDNKKYIYIDGVLRNKPFSQTEYAGPYHAYIGGYRSGSSYGYTGSMKIDDFRLVKGKAIYGNDFVPPTGALTNSTASISPGITVLLLNCNGSNGSTTFTDSGHKTLTPTVNGNAQISTTQSKFGGGSASFDGTGDYLIYSNGKDHFNLFNSNFTIECWVRMSNTTGAKVIFSKRANTSTYGGLAFGIVDGKPTCSATSNGSSWAVDFNTGSTTLSTNTWYHIALTRLYNTFRIFVDGIERGSSTVSDFIIAGNSDNMVIGAGSASGGQEFNGYIDDLRIIRGASLYNENFTVPTAALGKYPL
jgi:hypothetical protein